MLDVSVKTQVKRLFRPDGSVLEDELFHLGSHWLLQMVEVKLVHEVLVRYCVLSLQDVVLLWNWVLVEDGRIRDQLGFVFGGIGRFFNGG